MAIYVYILECADGSYYVGSARDTLERRVNEHNAGTHGGYTSTRRPVRLVWHQEFQRITDAIEMERRLKGWSRAKKAGIDPERLRRNSQTGNRTNQPSQASGIAPHPHSSTSSG
jgi:putative endonuclease